MLLWSRLRVRPENMMEHVKQREDMLPIVARLACADVIDNHLTNFFYSMLLMS
jgi:hypothetical protein